MLLQTKSIKSVVQKHKILMLQLKIEIHIRYPNVFPNHNKLINITN